MPKKSSVLIAVCLVAVCLVAGGSFLLKMWREKAVFTRCHELQKYTPDSEAAFAQCMRNNGLDPEDWN